MASYSDDFDRSNSNSLGASWDEWNEDDDSEDPYGIDSNAAESTWSGGITSFTRYYARYGTALTNESHKITCDFTGWPGTSGTWGVWGLYINGDTAAGTDETLLLLQIRNDDTTKLYIVESGSFTQLDTVSSVPAAGSVMVLERDGADVTVTDDGGEILSATLSGAQQTTLSGRNYGGLFVSAQNSGQIFNYDDFTIEDVAGAASADSIGFMAGLKKRRFQPLLVR